MSPPPRSITLRPSLDSTTPQVCHFASIQVNYSIIALCLLIKMDDRNDERGVVEESRRDSHQFPSFLEGLARRYLQVHVEESVWAVITV